MDFFMMTQDRTIPHTVEPVGILKVIDREMIKKENIHKLDGNIPAQLSIKDDSKAEYVDFIECPLTLVSDRLKELLVKYDDGIFFKPILLADIKRSRQEIYWLMIPKSVDCLLPESEFNKNGTLKNAVIDTGRIGFSKIFKINGIMENIIAIRLDLAESILRRDFAGISLKRIDVRKV